uniref:Uma2 family endonuclease n=1 Tax=Streptomyces sp. NBC_00008 TaxID=2903610 RepID=A0AAU2VS24_9ACTN
MSAAAVEHPCAGGPEPLIETANRLAEQHPGYRVEINYNSDLRHKVAAYADAKIPVYVIVDRKHGRVRVLTEPFGSTYDRHEVYAPGQEARLPESIGAEVTLDVAELINAGRSRS